MSATYELVDHSLRQLEVPEGSESLSTGIDILEALVEEELNNMFNSILDLQIQISELKQKLDQVEEKVEQRRAMLRKTLAQEMKLRRELIGNPQ